MRNFVITIGRQTGSGGREIAERLARRLGVVCYDKNALMELAQRTGGYEEVQAFYEEQPVNSLLYAIAMENFEQNIGEKPFGCIRNVCAKEPCILLGRCGNYIFRVQQQGEQNTETYGQLCAGQKESREGSAGYG